MKKFITIFLLIFIVPLYSKDYHKTEEMINSILAEEKNTGIKKAEQNLNVPDDKTSEKDKENDKTAGENDKNKNSAMLGKDEVLLKTGIQLYESGLLDHSLIRFKDLIKNYPSSPFLSNARMFAGKIHLKKYQYDEAIKQFEEINDKSGEYQAALYFKAEAYRYKSDPINAIEYYQKLSSSYPEHELADNAILTSGKLYLNSNKGYQALESAIKIVRYYKDKDTVDDAYYLIAKIYEKDPILKDMEMSRKFYKIFLQKSEQNQKHFADSPLIPAVKKDLEHLEKTYFKFEK
jgi:outer membrane protein assembly factor BamD (BamD/ComL family)